MSRPLVWIAATLLGALPLLADNAVVGQTAERKPSAENSRPAAVFPELLAVKRIHVERMTGETANHVRDMIINSLQSSGLFQLTENPERADAILRGSAEDLIFTDHFQADDSINARVSAGAGGYNRTSSNTRRSASAGIGEHESTRISERKHEAAAAVRLVNKDGDVIWSTTQESLGAKFRGASADVANKIVRRLLDDYDRARRLRNSAVPNADPLSR